MPIAARTFDRKHWSRFLTKRTIDKNIKNSQLEKFYFIKSIVNRQSYWGGFSLIELLVVIAIFVLTSTMVLAGYLTFERNQRLKSAALDLKSNIRLAQNKALTGDKADIGACGTPTTLVGWYVRFQTGSPSSYTINGNYLCGLTETIFGSKTLTFPKGVTLSSITFGSNRTEANILFRPLSEIVSFHSAMPTPDFLDSSGNLRAQLSGGTELEIELVAQNVSSRYRVKVRSTGEVYEEFVP